MKDSKQKYVYFGNCTNTTAEHIWNLRDSSKQISWYTFVKRIPEARKFFRDLGGILEGASDKQVNESNFFSFYKGTFMNMCCYYACWSGYEWIWISPKEYADRYQER